MKATTLPVVAMGAIPHIYRRASFSLRATPVRTCPDDTGRGKVIVVVHKLTLSELAALVIGYDLLWSGGGDMLTNNKCALHLPSLSHSKRV